MFYSKKIRQENFYVHLKPVFIVIILSETFHCFGYDEINPSWKLMRPEKKRDF